MANAHDLLMAQRAAMMGGKPLPYLKRVAYLESHGTEWIDTGCRANINTYARVSFKVSSTSVVSRIFGAAEISDNDRSFFVRSFDSRTSFYANFDSKSRTTVKSQAYDDQFHETELSKDGWLVDSELCAIWEDPSDFITSLSLCLFKINSRSTSFNIPMNGRIYEAFFENTEDVYRLHLIPVLNLSGRPAMYDEVSGQLFYNQGTGEFTPGPDVT